MSQSDLQTSFILCEKLGGGLTPNDIVNHTTKWIGVKKAVRLQPNSILREFYPLIRRKERIYDFLKTVVVNEREKAGVLKSLKCAFGRDEVRRTMFAFESILNPTDVDYQKLSSKLICYVYLEDLLREYEIYSLFSKFGKEFDEDL